MFGCREGQRVFQRKRADRGWFLRSISYWAHCLDVICMVFFSTLCGFILGWGCGWPADRLGTRETGPHLANCARYPGFLYAAPSRATCAAFIKESRMKLIGPTDLHRKSGDMGHPSLLVDAVHLIPTSFTENLGICGLCTPFLVFVIGGREVPAQNARGGTTVVSLTLSARSSAG